jgi:hypothetical protein
MNCSSLMHLQICVAAPEQHAAAQACRAVACALSTVGSELDWGTRAVACALSTVGSELDLRMRGTVETKFAVAPLHLTITCFRCACRCFSIAKKKKVVERVCGNVRRTHGHDTLYFTASQHAPKSRPRLLLEIARNPCSRVGAAGPGWRLM